MNKNREASWNLQMMWSVVHGKKWSENIENHWKKEQQSNYRT